MGSPRSLNLRGVGAAPKPLARGALHCSGNPLGRLGGSARSDAGSKRAGDTRSGAGAAGLFVDWQLARKAAFRTGDHLLRLRQRAAEGIRHPLLIEERSAALVLPLDDA